MAIRNFVKPDFPFVFFLGCALRLVIEAAKIIDSRKVFSSHRLNNPKFYISLISIVQ